VTGRTPAAFGASLRARLRNLAKATGRPVGELEREYLLQRFLARVFHDLDAGWILKGGTGLLARLPGGRHSQDIDLLHPVMALPAAVAALQEVAAVDAGDPFRFVVGPARAMVGGVAGAKVPVTAYLGARVAGQFPIDLSTELRTVAAVEVATVTPILTDPDVAPLPPFVLYPLADQVADKVCALYERHGPQRGPSSRYRDLVDLVLVTGHFDLDAAQLTAALAQESARRQLELPASVDVPGPAWAREFPRTARGTLVPASQQQLPDALAAVGRCLDPLLAGARSTGRWVASTSSWSDAPPGAGVGPPVSEPADEAGRLHGQVIGAAGRWQPGSGV